jgi:hypothetical protein
VKEFLPKSADRAKIAQMKLTVHAPLIEQLQNEVHTPKQVFLIQESLGHIRDAISEAHQARLQKKRVDENKNRFRL